MTPQRLKILFAVVGSLLFAGCASLGGKDLGPSVKVYWSMPAVGEIAGGMLRKQTGEFVSYDHTRGWFCFKPSDFEVIVNSMIRSSEGRP